MSRPHTWKAAPERRLGKRELGRHANESRMPTYLYNILRKSEYVQHATPNLIPVLSHVCQQTTTIKSTFLCHPSVEHIGKLNWLEGHNFCGYHNTQMQLSYVRSTKSAGHERFEKGIPSVLGLQELIEEAWDGGFNAGGRVQTGGVRGTRKYIGTSEVQALFRSMGMECRAAVFPSSKKVEDGKPAYEELLDFVQEYFSIGSSANKSPTTGIVYNTTLPPIYLQRPRHSLTIIGFALNTNGSRDLLVFDPASNPSKRMKALSLDPSKIRGQRPETLLKDYRRGARHLTRFRAFETLRLINNV